MYLGDAFIYIYIFWNIVGHFLLEMLCFDDGRVVDTSDRDFGISMGSFIRVLYVYLSLEILFWLKMKKIDKKRYINI